MNIEESVIHTVKKTVRTNSNSRFKLSKIKSWFVLKKKPFKQSVKRLVTGPQINSHHHI